jgi:hypothetical protein
MSKINRYSILGGAPPLLLLVVVVRIYIMSFVVLDVPRLLCSHRLSCHTASAMVYILEGFRPGEIAEPSIPTG